MEALLHALPELLLSLAVLLAGGSLRRRLIRDVTREVVAELREEYVRLDYPNAKPIHDIHRILERLAQAGTCGGAPEETHD